MYLIIRLGMCPITRIAQKHQLAAAEEEEDLVLGSIYQEN